METSCANCGTAISRKPREIKERNYCSRTCWYASGASRPGRMTGMVKACETCGAEFYAQRVHADQRYCSMACKGIGSRKTFTCETCGAETYGYANRSKRWCNRACASAARKTGETLACEQCGMEFYVERGRAALPETRFCSHACASAWQGRNKTEHTCKICAVPFRWSPSRTEGGKYNVTYCSLACRDRDPDVKTRLIAMQASLQRGRTTWVESAGYAVLESIGVGFERQVPFNGKFTPDATIATARLVVQFDGDYWHDRRGDSAEDRIRRRVALDISQDSYIRACGWQVVRLWGSDLKADPLACAEKVRLHLRPPS